MTARTMIIELTLTLCLISSAFGQTESINPQAPAAIPQIWADGCGPAPILHGFDGTTTTLSKIEATENEAGDLANAAQDAQAMGQYAVAEDDAKQSLALDYGSGLAQKVLAASLYAQGLDQQAMAAYQTIAEGGFNDSSDAWTYDLLLLKAGNWPQAVAVYNIALGLGGDVKLLRDYSSFSPFVPQPVDLAAAIHIGIGTDSGWALYHGTDKERNEQALDQFKEALELKPGNAIGTYYYGLGLYNMGQRSEARTYFQKAADMTADPKVKAVAEDALKY